MSVAVVRVVEFGTYKDNGEVNGMSDVNLQMTSRKR